MRIIVDNIACQCVIGGLDNKNCNVHKELREYLRVRPANYGMILMQMRRHGNKGWDGYTYFINDKGKFATGFLSMVLNFLHDLGVSVDLEDRRTNVPVFNQKPWNFSTPEFELAQHQIDTITKTHNHIGGVANCLYFPRGIWDVAPNGGKTAAAGNLILNTRDGRAIMLVDNIGLLKQHYAYYKTVFTGKDDIGFITSSKIKLGNVLTLAMVRTLYNRLKASLTLQRDLHDKFNMLLVDESHGFGGKEALFVISHINAGLRIAMSGTPLDMADKITRFRLLGAFGAVLHQVTNRYLMDNGFSMVPEIEIYLNPTNGLALTYDAEMAKVIYQSEERAELIADIICKYRKQKILTSFFDIKHGRLMHSIFCERYPTLADKAACISAKSEDREQVVQAFKDGDIKYLFASSFFQQGFNIPDIGVVIYAIGEKAAIPQLQVMGRGQRLDGVNNAFKFIDFYDQGKHCSKHSRKRIAQYKKEDLPLPIVFKYEARKNGTPK